MPQRARIARIAVPIFLLSAPAGARETRQLTAVRVGSGVIQVDGSLDDPGWAGVAFTAGSLQKRPVDGAAPSQPTEGIAHCYARTTMQEAVVPGRFDQMGQTP
jgi:hypothetical protein